MQHTRFCEKGIVGKEIQNAIPFFGQLKAAVGKKKICFIR